MLVDRTMMPSVLLILVALLCCQARVHFVGDNVNLPMTPATCIPEEEGSAALKCTHNVVYLGCGRCGSTSLAAYVLNHPQVRSCAKEQHAFDGGKGPYQRLVKVCKDRTPIRPDEIFAEFNPYTTTDPLAFAKILSLGMAFDKPTRDLLSNMKFIMMVPEPVKNCHSSVPGDAEKYISKHCPSVAPGEPCDLSNYYPSPFNVEWHFRPCAWDPYLYMKWLTAFPLNDILFIEAGEFHRDPQRVLEAVFNFMGVSESPITVHEKNLNARPHGALPNATKCTLEASYGPRIPMLSRVVNALHMGPAQAIDLEKEWLSKYTACDNLNT